MDRRNRGILQYSIITTLNEFDQSAHDSSAGGKLQIWMCSASAVYVYALLGKCPQKGGVMPLIRDHKRISCVHRREGNDEYEITGCMCGNQRFCLCPNQGGTGIVVSGFPYDIYRSICRVC